MTVFHVSTLQPTELNRMGNSMTLAIRRNREQQLDPLRRSLASVGERNVTFDFDRDHESVHDQVIGEK